MKREEIKELAKKVSSSTQLSTEKLLNIIDEIIDIQNSTGIKFKIDEEYLPLIQEFNLDYIPLLCEVDDPTEKDLLNISKLNKFLVKEGVGEGITIKRYDFKNRFGRTVFAKLIVDEFLNNKKQKSKK